MLNSESFLLKEKSELFKILNHYLQKE